MLWVSCSHQETLLLLGNVVCQIATTWKHKLLGNVVAQIETTWKHKLLGNVVAQIATTWKHKLLGNVVGQIATTRKLYCCVFFCAADAAIRKHSHC